MSSSVLFYGEMLFLRTKLQFYRVIQIRAVKWFLRSFKRNSGLYFCLFAYGAYFGHLRKKYMFVKDAKSGDRKTQIEVQTKQIDLAFREFLKYAMSDLLFSNAWIDDLTGKALYDLT